MYRIKYVVRIGNGLEQSAHILGGLRLGVA